MKNFTTLAIALVFSLISVAAMAANVNTDNAETLAAEIMGVGVKKAALIVEEREANGDFTDGEDLVTRVKGIGPKTIEKNVDTLEFKTAKK